MVTFKHIVLDKTRHKKWFAVAAEEGFLAAAKRGAIRLEGK